MINLERQNAPNQKKYPKGAEMSQKIKGPDPHFGTRRKMTLLSI